MRRFGNGRPIKIYLPEGKEGPVPIVIFNHGRPFKNIHKGFYTLHRYHPIVQYLNVAGIAVAIPVRTGYYSSGGKDGERIPYDRPRYVNFQRAAAAAQRDVGAAVRFVRKLPMIDPDMVYVGGSSAGGFATGVSLGKLEGLVRGAFVFNGGRCGSRGKLSRGIGYAERLFREAAKKSSMPMVFFASDNDSVITPASTKRLYQAFCKGRGSNGARSVFFSDVRYATHDLARTAEVASDSLIKFVNDLPGFLSASSGCVSR